MSCHDGTILIAHERKFMALYIERMLDGTDFRIVGNLSGPRVDDDLPDIPAPALCIVGACSPMLEQVCIGLRTRFGSTRIVLVCSEDVEETGHVARGLGADGCLSLDLPPVLFLSALELVATGTRCFPRIGASEGHVTPPAIACHAGAGATPGGVLTPREDAVLCLIGEGLANKVIARKLSIAESTVKAHMNAVLRKTGTANRTQAARWAFLRGRPT